MSDEDERERSRDERIEEDEKKVKELTTDGGYKFETFGDWAAKVGQTTFWSCGKDYEFSVHGTSLNVTKGWMTEVITLGEEILTVGEKFAFVCPIQFALKLPAVVELKAGKVDNIYVPGCLNLSAEKIWKWWLKRRVNAEHDRLNDEESILAANRKKIRAQANRTVAERTRVIARLQKAVASKLKTIASKTQAIETQEQAYATRLDTAGERTRLIENQQEAFGAQMVEVGDVNRTAAEVTEVSALRAAQPACRLINQTFEAREAALSSRD